MDRRTVLAFLIIGVIIFLMPHYIRWLQGDPPEHVPVIAPDVGSPPRRHVLDEPARLDAQPAARTHAEPVAEAPKPPTQARTDTSVATRTLVVETDLYVATFSTRGARLVSFVLKDFESANGGWLELVAPGGYGLAATVGDRSLEDEPFDTDADGLFLRGSEQGEIAFSADVAEGRITKRLRFQGNRYRMEAGLEAPGLMRGMRTGLMWQGGLAVTEGDIDQDAPYAKVKTRVGEVVQEFDAGDLEEEPAYLSGSMSWVGVRSKYFLAAFLTAEGRYELHIDGSEAEDRTRRYDVGLSHESQGENLRLGLYIGPISYNLLLDQDTGLDGVRRTLELDEVMDYGWRFLRPIMKPVTILILRAFLALHEVIPNYGIVIISFSLFVKIVLFPLTHKSLEASAKMQQLQPQIAALREKHGSDQQKVNQEMMKLYREEKVNPLGGCLPMVFQMPILFSLFNVFRGAIELRQAAFAFWITDLSQPDRLLVGGFEVHVLPLLMAASMFVQQKMTMKDPKQAAMVYLMPALMTFFFWSMSSGLVLYWTMFNVLTLAQQQVMEYTKSVLGTK